jgi:hypothetical protein
MRMKILLPFLAILLFSTLVLAASYTPPGDIDMRYVYNMSNTSSIRAVLLNATGKVCLAGDCRTTWPSSSGAGNANMTDVDNLNASILAKGYLTQAGTGDANLTDIASLNASITARGYANYSQLGVYALISQGYANYSQLSSYQTVAQAQSNDSAQWGAINAINSTGSVGGGNANMTDIAALNASILQTGYMNYSQYTAPSPGATGNANMSNLAFYVLSTASINASLIINPPVETPDGNIFLTMWNGSNAIARTFRSNASSYPAANVTNPPWTNFSQMSSYATIVLLQTNSTNILSQGTADNTTQEASLAILRADNTSQGVAIATSLANNNTLKSLIQVNSTNLIAAQMANSTTLAGWIGAVNSTALKNASVANFREVVINASLASVTPLWVRTIVNGFAQMVLSNPSNATTGSVGYVVNATRADQFGEFGINSDNNTDQNFSSMGKNDVYLLSNNSNIAITPKVNFIVTTGGFQNTNIGLNMSSTTAAYTRNITVSGTLNVSQNISVADGGCYRLGYGFSICANSTGLILK